MIRNVLFTSVAFLATAGMSIAADLPGTRTPYAPAPIPVFSWTGFYLGGQAGYQWGTDYLTAPLVPGANRTIHPAGVVGGAHAGYNWQSSNFVFGLEADVDGSGYKGYLGALGTVTSSVEGSLRARGGFAVDRVLFFATGGLAVASFTNNYIGLFSTTPTSTGYTVGGGLEYAVGNNWSVFGEYRYIAYGSKTDSLAGINLITHKNTEEHADAGFSYKFNLVPAPVIAKY